MSDYKQKYLKYKKKYLDLKEQSGGMFSPLPNITFDAEWIMDEKSVSDKKQNFNLYVVESYGLHELKLIYQNQEPLQLKKESPIKKYIVDETKVVYRFFVDKIKHPDEKDFFINWDNEKNPGLIDEFYANAKKKITILKANNMENIKQKQINEIIKEELNENKQSGGDVQRIVREIYSVNAKLINFPDDPNNYNYSIDPEINLKFNLVEYKYKFLAFKNYNEIEVEYNGNKYTLLAKRPFVKFIIDGDNNREVYQLITDKNKVDKTNDIFITDVKSSITEYPLLESFYVKSAKGFLTPKTSENSFVEKFKIKKENLKMINDNVLTAYIDNNNIGYFDFTQQDLPNSYEGTEKPFYVV